MITLIGIGFLAGVIAGISPCILPVLPVVLAVGASGTADAGRRSVRPYALVAGLVVSFCLSVLFGSLLLGALHLPADLLRTAGVVALALIGLSLLSRRLGDLLARPFARLPHRKMRSGTSGFGLGLGVGLLFAPCAGPVLAAISVVGAAHRFGGELIALTMAFGVGVGIPLLALALAGDTVTRRTGLLRSHARGARATAGVVMIAVAVTVGGNLTDSLARRIPAYTAALQDRVETGGTADAALQRLTAVQPAPTPAPAVQPAPGVAAPPSCRLDRASRTTCGVAPELTGISTWLNTPGGGALTLAQLRGKVVLVDFWTFACINCQRTLPYLNAWYSAYHDAGLEIIGVHTPELPFEREPDNVAYRTRDLDVKYPVAIDNDYRTWNAYGNRYWPAEYLVDAGGTIREIHAGEGAYRRTEDLIRGLLTAANPSRPLPPRTSATSAD